MAVDVLVFGPHPDDLEIGLGGTIARHTSLGFQVGLCDLTAGELGTNGTPDQRLAEADAAAKVLGVAWRTNLRWPDREIGKHPEQVADLVAFIRKHRPRVIAAPYWTDRHPDHGAASAIITEAAFTSGLRRYLPGGDPWRPDWICYYFINDSMSPSFLVDVSATYDRKRQALDCHRSQFQHSDTGTAPTRLNVPGFRQLIESRDAQFGALAGVTWAEGIVVREPIVRETLIKAVPSV
jgi:bacillithiol biosynthesis deacetylase BshB1